MHIGHYALEIAIAIPIIKLRYFPYDLWTPYLAEYGCVFTNLLNVTALILCTISRTILDHLITNNFVKSSLVRQRAAQWKEKEALGGRLPIPVPKAKD